MARTSQPALGVNAPIAFGMILLGVWQAPAAHPARGSVWLIDTRAISDCGREAARRAQYWRLGPDRRWIAADWKAFVAADDPAVPTAFFVHGNRTNRCQAVQLGLLVQNILSDQAPDRPFRLVIWSWPAERLSAGHRRDARAKAARSDLEGSCLADCLRQMDPHVPVSLIGFSFGARAIAKALSLLAREPVAAGRPADGGSNQPAALRAVLIAAAMDNTALGPARGRPSALSSLERILITCNPADAALRWYRHLDCRRRPDALGYTGPVCQDRLGPDSRRIELLNLSGEVGRRHDSVRYLTAPSLRARLGWYAFLEPEARGSPGAGAKRADLGWAAVPAAAKHHAAVPATAKRDAPLAPKHRGPQQ
ncbi:MAG: hypothetical protein ACUVUC_11440 [Thermoguttaceae bacterium]